MNTHGFEIEENEHAVERQVYLDIKPMSKQSEIVRALKNQAGEEWKSRCTEHFAWKAAEHIQKLELRLSEQKDIEEHMWKSLDKMTKMRDNADKAHLLIHNENEFLKSLIRKYHLENDAFTGKGNIE